MIHKKSTRLFMCRHSDVFPVGWQLKSVLWVLNLDILFKFWGQIFWQWWMESNRFMRDILSSFNLPSFYLTSHLMQPNIFTWSSFHSPRFYFHPFFLGPILHSYRRGQVFLLYDIIGYEYIYRPEKVLWFYL